MKCLSLVLAGALLAGAPLAHAATITVTSTADNTTVDGQVTLREAITASNGHISVDGSAVGTGNDTIVFAVNVTPTITVNTLLPVITGNLIINGPSVSLLNITSAAAGDNSRKSIFLLGSSGTATFNNLTISQGLAGFCIESPGSALNVNNCNLLGGTDPLSIWAGEGINDIPISSFTGTLSVTNCNVTGFAHGGIYCQGINHIVTGSTFYNNLVGESCSGTTTQMTNCTFTGNSNSAISALSATITVTNCTIAGNTSGFTTNGQTVTRKNTICVDPVPNGFPTNFTNLGNNLTSGNHVAPLANNGGPTLTMMPLVGSPAIDGGKDSAPVTTDQRGLARPYNDPNVANATGGDASDIGAVEARPSVKININSITSMEYSYGTAYVYFTISLSAAETFPVTVTYTTVNGTAVASTGQAPGDYITATGSVTFSPGQRSKAIGVLVRGDLLVEPNEDFMVNLSNPIGGVIAVGQGVCTIINDD